MSLSRPSPLAYFLLKAVFFLVLLTLGWSWVSKWTSYPIALATKAALVYGAEDWVQSVQVKLGVVEVQTRLVLKVQGSEAELLVDADPAHYAYGLPVFLALLAAAMQSGQWQRLLKLSAAGFFLLLPGQAFSLSMELLRQMISSMPGGARALGVGQWQLEAIALGYQLGSMLLPSLVPILLWAWLDKAAIAKLVSFSR